MIFRCHCQETLCYTCGVDGLFLSRVSISQPFRAQYWYISSVRLQSVTC